MHLSRWGAEHRNQWSNGAFGGDGFLVLLIAFSHLLHSLSGERAKLDDGQILHSCTRKSEQHVHQLRDAASPSNLALVLFRPTTKLLERTDCVLLGFGASVSFGIEQGEERHDAIGVDNRLAVVL